MEKKLLAVASAGGHWVQLRRLTPSFEGYQVIYLTTNEAYASSVKPEKLFVVNDANLWDKFGLLRMAFKVLWIVIKVRPDVVISTGAAPGYFALRFAKMLRSKTIWLDSIANVEQLSTAGSRVGKYADLWLTQWPHLSKDEGPNYKGAVL